MRSRLARVVLALTLVSLDRAGSLRPLDRSLAPDLPGDLDRADSLRPALDWRRFWCASGSRRLSLAPTAFRSDSSGSPASATSSSARSTSAAGTWPRCRQGCASSALVGNGRCSAGLVFRAMIANRFFSAVVRIQGERGHRVIDQGPYALIRHPGYAGMILSVPCSGLALGSWLGGRPGAGLRGADAEARALRGRVPAHEPRRDTPSTGRVSATGWFPASGDARRRRGGGPRQRQPPSSISWTAAGIEAVLLDQDARGQRVQRVVRRAPAPRPAARSGRRRARRSRGGPSRR